MKRRALLVLTGLALCAWVVRPGQRRPALGDVLDPEYADVGEYAVHGVPPPAGAPFPAFRLPFVGVLTADLVGHERLSAAAFERLCKAAAVGGGLALAAALAPGAAAPALAAAAFKLGHAWRADVWRAREWVAIFALLAAALAAWRRRSPTVARSAALASAIGASFLCRSTLAFLPPALAALDLLPARGRGPRPPPASTLVVLLLPYLFTLPWLGLNWTLSRELVPFERGAASANVVAGALGRVETVEGDPNALAAGRLPDAGRSGVLGWAAGEVARHPVRSAASFARRVRLVLSWHPLIALFGALGLWWGRRRAGFRDAAAVAAYLLFVPCLMAIEPGYFFGLWPLLAVAGAAGLAARFDRPPRAERRAAARAALAACGVLLAAILLDSARVAALLRRYPADAAAPDALARELRERPGDPWLLDLSARGRLAAGDAAGAAADLERACGRRPDDRALALRRAWALALTGRAGALLSWRDAETDESGEYVLREDRTDMRARVLIAWVRAASGRDEEAARQIRAARALQDRMALERGEPGAERDEDLARLRSASWTKVVDEARDQLGSRPFAERARFVRVMRRAAPEAGRAWDEQLLPETRDSAGR